MEGWKVRGNRGASRGLQRVMSGEEGCRGLRMIEGRCRGFERLEVGALVKVETRKVRAGSARIVDSHMGVVQPWAGLMRLDVWRMVQGW